MCVYVRTCVILGKSCVCVFACRCAHRSLLWFVYTIILNLRETERREREREGGEGGNMKVSVAQRLHDSLIASQLATPRDYRTNLINPQFLDIDSLLAHNLHMTGI